MGISFPSGAGTRAGVSGAFGLTSEPKQGPVCAPESQQLGVFLALWAAGLAALLSFAQPAAAEAVSYTDESHQDRRVFSVGDLHGDAQSCQKILK